MGSLHSSSKRRLVGALVVFWFACLEPRPCAAIPVFAHIYGKPCHACHTVFPQLNPAGEAFRAHGLHGLTPVVEPIKLSPYFSLPGTLPVAITAAIGEDLTHTDPPAGSDTTRTHLNVEFLSLLFGGELGPYLSFLGDYAPVVIKDPTTGETDILTRPGMAFLQAHAAPGDWLLNLRLGLFELPLGTSPRVHRLTARPRLIYGMSAFRLLNRRPVMHGRADTLNLSSTQIGAEASAIRLGPALEAAGGVVTGSNNRVDNNDTADFYARIGWRPGPNRAGIFFYYSPDTASGTLDDDVIRVGPDVELYWRRAQLAAQFLAGHDSNPTGRKVGLWHYGGFLEADYRLTAALMALGRIDAVGMASYDDRDKGGTSHVDRTLWELTSGLQYLIRENLKLVAEVTYAENRESVSDTKLANLFATIRVQTAFWPLEPPLISEWLGHARR